MKDKSFTESVQFWCIVILLLAAFGYFMSSCTVNRYYVIKVEMPDYPTYGIRNDFDPGFYMPPVNGYELTVTPAPYEYIEDFIPAISIPKIPDSLNFFKINKYEK